MFLQLFDEWVNERADTWNMFEEQGLMWARRWKLASSDLEKESQCHSRLLPLLSPIIPSQSSGSIDSSVNILLSQSHPVTFILPSPSPARTLSTPAWTTAYASSLSNLFPFSPFQHRSLRDHRHPILFLPKPSHHFLQNWMLPHHLPDLGQPLSLSKSQFPHWEHEVVALLHSTPRSKTLVLFPPFPFFLSFASWVLDVHVGSLIFVAGSWDLVPWPGMEPWAPSTGTVES